MQVKNEYRYAYMCFSIYPFRFILWTVRYEGTPIRKSNGSLMTRYWAIEGHMCFFLYLI